MLSFNPKRIFSMRGVEKAVGFMVKHGFSYDCAGRILKAKSQFVKIKDIERLCVALNCTPNDLFEWKPDAATILADGHSLNALHKGAATKNLQQMIKDVPSDKLAQVEGLLNELKNG